MAGVSPTRIRVDAVRSGFVADVRRGAGGPAGRNHRVGVGGELVDRDGRGLSAKGLADEAG